MDTNELAKKNMDVAALVDSLKNEPTIYVRSAGPPPREYEDEKQILKAMNREVWRDQRAAQER